MNAKTVKKRNKPQINLFRFRYQNLRNDMTGSDEITITAHPQSDPMVCKFVVDRKIHNGNLECKDKGQAKGALLEELFAVEGVSEVQVAEDTVTVVKSASLNWEELGKKIGSALRVAIQSGKKLIPDPSSPKEIEKAVKDFLHMQIRPALAQHGGSVELVEIKDDIVYIELSGGCRGCRMAQMTIKNGIETAIKQVVPSIKEVRDTTDHAAGNNPYA